MGRIRLSRNRREGQVNMLKIEFFSKIDNKIVKPLLVYTIICSKLKELWRIVEKRKHKDWKNIAKERAFIAVLRACEMKIALSGKRDDTVDTSRKCDTAQGKEGWKKEGIQLFLV